MSKYNVVMEMNDSTVVTEYEPIKKKSDSYQSEQALENEFIRMLEEQGYEYLKLHDSDTLVKNLRTQLEILNDYKFGLSLMLRGNSFDNTQGVKENVELLPIHYPLHHSCSNI